MRELLEYLYSIKFNSEAIGIQKDLLLAALIGVVSNLPKEVKSNFKQAAHIIVGTLLSTILTPMVMAIIEGVLNIKLPPESGYGIAALVGIVGVNSIKRIILSRFTSTKTKTKTNDDDDETT